MNPGWVSLAALSGWLVLALFALRARRLNGRTTISYALVWGAIFLLAATVFAVVGPKSP